MLNKKNQDHWRFWPVICLAFFYPINNFLIGLAVPLYYFKEGVSPEIIGFLTSSITITYCFSPVLFYKFSNRIGRKRSIIIAMIGTSLAQLIFYFTLDPLPFLISRLIEGLVMGLFWSSLQASISNNSLHNHSKYISRYNISWNLGGIVGYLLGTVILYVINSLKIVYYISPIFVFINVFIAIFFFQDSNQYNNNLIKLNKTNLIKREDFAIKKESKKDLQYILKYSIPLIVPILYITAYSLPRATISFLYPIKSQILGFEDYSVYLLSFLTILTQMISTSLASFISMKILKKITLISIPLQSLTLFLFGINNNYYMFIVLSLFVGFIGGLLYGVGLKIFLAFDIKENTSKYPYIIESLLGIFFLIAPIASGFIVLFDLNLSFYLFSLIVFLIFVIDLIFSSKIKENNN